LIKIIKQNKIKDKEKVCEIGDILYGKEYFTKPDSSFYKKRSYLPITALFYNVWKSLEDLKIDYKDFKRDVSYECPFGENIYFWAIPIYLFSENIDKILDETKANCCKALYKDQQWVKSFFGCEKEFKINNISESHHGHGYTCGTLPCDGGGRSKDAIMKLDNGDYLGCKVWVWYNK